MEARSRIVGSLLLLGLVAGCNGPSEVGPDGGSVAFQSSLLGTRELGSLSSADAVKLCQEWSAWEQQQLADSIALECRVQALSDAQLTFGADAAPSDAALQRACRKSYEQCLQAPPSEDTPDCSDPNLKPSKDCHATVAEAEACRNEQFARYKKLLDGVLECGAVTKAYIHSSGPQAALDDRGPACQIFIAKCSEQVEASSAQNATVSSLPQ